MQQAQSKTKYQLFSFFLMKLKDVLIQNLHGLHLTQTCLVSGYTWVLPELCPPIWSHLLLFIFAFKKASCDSFKFSSCFLSELAGFSLCSRRSVKEASCTCSSQVLPKWLELSTAFKMQGAMHISSCSCHLTMGPGHSLISKYSQKPFKKLAADFVYGQLFWVLTKPSHFSILEFSEYEWVVCSERDIHGDPAAIPISSFWFWT